MNMNRGKVLAVDFSKNNMNMGQRIEAAKQKAEADYNNKINKSREADVDVRDFFTPEELDRILSDDYFSGKVANLSVMQRYNKVKQAAQWLEANSMEVTGIEIEPLSKNRPNAVITIEIRRLASLRGKELRVFSAMNILADSVFMSGIKDSAIRFTFGLEGVWEK